MDANHAWPKVGVLERDREIAELAAAAAEAATGTGSVVLVSGEAGIGKSSVVNAARDVLPPHVRLLVGYCDDLATPRTLGPFRDLLGLVGNDLTNALAEGGDRERVFDALRAELSWAATPTVLAVEDVHWADDATLDALTYLIRRVADLSAVLVLTYRDDDLGPTHPLQRVLGLTTQAPRVRRLKLARLSESAVLRLTAPSRLDPREVYAVTGGNPFFVTEILASATISEVPATVVDAVQSRIRRLDIDSQHALEQLSVIPSTVDRWLLDTLLPLGMAAVAVGEQRGLLDVSASRIGFRHELIRRTIADSLPGAWRVELNQRVCDALIKRDGSDLSRIVHHAAEAGDEDAIIHYGPRAAADAARAGSHRQAAAHLKLVLQWRDHYQTEEQADLLSDYAVECYTIGEAQDAVDAQRDAVALRREIGDMAALGRDLSLLARMSWVAGDPDLMEASSDEAIRVLSNASEDRLLAQALSNKSQLHMLARRNEEAIRVGQFAIGLARTVGDPAILSHALNNVGTALWSLGSAKGRVMLEESLAAAMQAGSVDDACRAHLNIIASLLENALPAEAAKYMPAALELAASSEYLMYYVCFHAHRADVRLAMGLWDQAIADARVAAAQTQAEAPIRCPALRVWGRVQTRRGHPDADRLLAEAAEFARQTKELHHTGPVAASLAEAAWLRDDQATMIEVLEPVYAEAVQTGSIALRAELGYWLSKAGVAVEPDRSAHPYALLLAGQHAEAAAFWRENGCPYEHALALIESGEQANLLTALSILDGLGAEPLARRVRGQLRELGVARIPRGPATTTRVNPAGLTGRQLEVARLLAGGLTNAEIAERLVVSVRTVDNHVAAVFAKLGARTRRDIAARLAELVSGKK